jgi:hypothetical protein
MKIHLVDGCQHKFDMEARIGRPWGRLAIDPIPIEVKCQAGCGTVLEFKVGKIQVNYIYPRMPFFG